MFHDIAQFILYERCITRLSDALADSKKQKRKSYKNVQKKHNWYFMQSKIGQSQLRKIRPMFLLSSLKLLFIVNIKQFVLHLLQFQCTSEVSPTLVLLYNKTNILSFLALL